MQAMPDTEAAEPGFSYLRQHSAPTAASRRVALRRGQLPIDRLGGPGHARGRCRPGGDRVGQRECARLPRGSAGPRRPLPLLGRQRPDPGLGDRPGSRCRSPASHFPVPSAASRAAAHLGRAVTGGAPPSAGTAPRWTSAGESRERIGASRRNGGRSRRPRPRPCAASARCRRCPTPMVPEGDSAGSAPPPSPRPPRQSERPGPALSMGPDRHRPRAAPPSAVAAPWWLRPALRLVGAAMLRTWTSRPRSGRVARTRPSGPSRWSAARSSSCSSWRAGRRTTT